MLIIKFYWLNFDLDPMTLILKLDLDIVEMYVCAQNEATTFNSSKVIAWTDRNTDRQTDSIEIITYPHMWIVP